MQAIASVNDFVVKFANVNGSGSASANALFAKAILRMGVPVSPRDIFPSNIQGLPTWYEVRVSDRGWLGRRGGRGLIGTDVGRTWPKSAGRLSLLRSANAATVEVSQDINVIGMPLMESATRPGDAPAALQGHHQWARWRRYSTSTWPSARS
jgi:2-oxoglutarate ferredoxin oxidoreductase subunit alpha